MSIENGSTVIVYLGSPREQVFGRIDSLNASGITMRGITLGSVDDWLRELVQGLEGEDASFGLTTSFYPMHRVEKIVLDEPSPGVPSIQDRFRHRTGETFSDFMDRS